MDYSLNFVIKNAKLKNLVLLLFFATVGFSVKCLILSIDLSPLFTEKIYPNYFDRSLFRSNPQFSESFTKNNYFEHHKYRNSFLYENRNLKKSLPSNLIIDSLNFIPTNNHLSILSHTEFLDNNYRESLSSLNLKNVNLKFLFKQPVPHAFNICEYESLPILSDIKNTVLLGETRVSLAEYKKIILRNNFKCKTDPINIDLCRANLFDYSFSVGVLTSDNLPSDNIKLVCSYYNNMTNCYISELNILNKALLYYKGASSRIDDKNAFEFWQRRQIALELMFNNQVCYKDNYLHINPSSMLKERTIINRRGEIISNLSLPLSLVKDFTIGHQVYQEITENKLFVQLEILSNNKVLSYLDKSPFVNALIKESSLSKILESSLNQAVYNEIKNIEVSEFNKFKLQHDEIYSYYVQRNNYRTYTLYKELFIQDSQNVPAKPGIAPMSISRIGLETARRSSRIPFLSDN